MALKTHLLKGKARYAKIVGEPRPGYGTEPGNGPLEWTFDLVLDEDGVKTALNQGVDPFYIRDDEKSNEKFIRFTRKAVKKEGDPAKPIEIVDHRSPPDNAWDGKTLIGNGSDLNVLYTLNEVNSKGKKKLKPQVIKVQVWNLVKYQPKGQFPSKDSTIGDEAFTPDDSN